MDEGIPCEIADPVSFQSERMEHAVSSLYNNIIKKTPSVFGAIYKLGDFYSSKKLPSPVYWANAQYADTLKSYILENGFDAVVCTHLYGMEAMTAIRQDANFKIPCYGVLTDYICIPFIDETHLDGYFVPNDDTRKELIHKGIAPDKVFNTGIPVNKAFSDHIDQVSARTKLGIPQDKKVFLIMTGGIGCENMLGLCDELLRSMRSDGMVYILVGKNDILKKKMDEKYCNNHQLQTVAFTKQVPIYMAASDVLLSKPGGLSSTEAAVANIPMVHVHAIPGCETYNARFFSENGLSLYAHDNTEAVTFANLLAYDRTESDRIRAMQRKLIPQKAAISIIKEMNRS